VKEADMLLVFIEIREGKIKKSSLEALGEAGRRAAELGTDVGATLVGPADAGLDAELFARGASKVYRLEHPLLADYSAQGYALALRELVDELRPAAVFFAATALGKDLAPRLAAKLGVAMASDCTKVAAAGRRLEFTRPVFAGKAFVTVVLKAEPQIATLRPNIFVPAAPQAGAAGETIVKAVEIPGGAIGGRVAEVVKESGEEIDVAEAEVIISGGRGLKGAENFALLKDLSAIIPRSAVGASRSAVDSGWIGHSHQVGQTGKTVSPNLYIAVGISGAIQHLAGMSSSKVIVAVNKDPEAPIFKVADYGIVGDLFQVVPALKEELKKLYAE
jgi:electron transfer flavoprotein alpha subunit